MSKFHSEATLPAREDSLSETIGPMSQRIEPGKNSEGVGGCSGSDDPVQLTRIGTAADDEGLDNDGYVPVMTPIRALPTRFLFPKLLLLLTLIISLSTAYPVFDIWGYFYLTKGNPYLHRVTFGNTTPTFDYFMVFFLAFKLSPCQFRPNRFLFTIAFLVGWFLRCALCFLPRWVIYQNVMDSDGVNAYLPPWAACINVVGRSVLLTFVVPLFFHYVYKLQRLRNPGPQDSGWDPNNTYLMYILVPWVIAFNTILLYSEFVEDEKEYTLIELPRESETVRLFLLTLKIGKFDWIAYLVAWGPTVLLCLLMLVDVSKKRSKTFGYSVRHLMAYIWAIQMFPFLTGSVLNYFHVFKESEATSSWLVQIVYIFIFAWLTLAMVKCVGLISDQKEGIILEICSKQTNKCAMYIRHCRLVSYLLL